MILHVFFTFLFVPAASSSFSFTTSGVERFVAEPKLKPPNSRTPSKRHLWFHPKRTKPFHSLLTCKSYFLMWITILAHLESHNWIREWIPISLRKHCSEMILSWVLKHTFHEHFHKYQFPILHLLNHLFPSSQNGKGRKWEHTLPTLSKQYMYFENVFTLIHIASEIRAKSQYVSHTLDINKFFIAKSSICPPPHKLHETVWIKQKRL